MLWGLDGLNLTTDIEFLHSVAEVSNRRMCRVVSTEDLDGFVYLVGTVDILNCAKLARPTDNASRAHTSEDSEDLIISGVAKGETGSGGNRFAVNVGLRDIKSYGHRPQCAIGETEVIYNALENLANKASCTNVSSHFL